MNDLPQSELARLHDIVSEINRREGWHFDSAKILSRWETTVREVEGTYHLGFDDYTNDLAVRELIVTILRDEQLPEFRAKVRELDDRFRAATVEVDEPLLAPGVLPNDEPEAHFYWYRVPRSAGDEFEGDLARMGFRRK
jgi:hypothetical protein